MSLVFMVGLLPVSSLGMPLHTHLRLGLNFPCDSESHQVDNENEASHFLVKKNSILREKHVLSYASMQTQKCKEEMTNSQLKI